MKNEIVGMSGSGGIKQEKKKLVSRIADRYGVDEGKMLTTLKNTAFKSDVDISNEQMMALLIVADQYHLNPFTKEIYAFPDKKKGGIVPVVGIDGWSRIINENPNCDGIRFTYSAESVKIDDDAKLCPEWIDCTIYRKDRAHNEPVREYLDEVYRPIGTYSDGNKMKPGPWQTHTKRFLRHKVLIQAARVTMGFVGIFDQDEAERIVEAQEVYEVAYTEAEQKEFNRLFNGNDALAFWLFWQTIDERAKVELFNSFPKKERGSDVPGKTENKERVRQLEAEGVDIFTALVDQLNQHIDNNDTAGVVEIKTELRTAGWDKAFDLLTAEQQKACEELMGAI